MDLKKEDGQEIRMLNGQCVITALTSYNNKATENQLIRYFMRRTNQPRRLVKEELNLILENGVSEGFLMKSEKKYLLPSQCNEYKIDGEDFVSDSEESASGSSGYEIIEPDEEEIKEKEEAYLAACNDIMSHDGSHFHDVLISNIIDFAIENVDEKDKGKGKAKSLPFLRLEFHIKAEELGPKMEEFYDIAYDRYNLEKKAPRFEILNSFRIAISEGWNEHELSGTRSCMEEKFKTTMQAIKDHDPAIVCLQFLDFVIFQVKNADSREEDVHVNEYHNDEAFSQSLKRFIDAAFSLAKCNEDYEFEKCYKSRSSGDDAKCATPRPILKAHGRIGTASSAPECSTMGPPAVSPPRIRPRKFTTYMRKPGEMPQPPPPPPLPPPPTAAASCSASWRMGPPNPPSMGPPKPTIMGPPPLPSRLTTRLDTFALPTPPSARLMARKGTTSYDPITKKPTIATPAAPCAEPTSIVPPTSCPDPTSMPPPTGRLGARKGTTFYDPTSKKPMIATPAAPCPEPTSMVSPTPCPEPMSMSPPKPRTLRVRERKGTTFYDPITKKPL